MRKEQVLRVKKLEATCKDWTTRESNGS